MRRSVLRTAAMALAIGLPQLPSQATDYTANFNDGATPPGMTLGGVAKIVPTGGAGGTGYLSLTDAVGSLTGGAVVADFNTNEVVGGFRASMKLRIGDGSARPADGFSLSVGTDVTDAGGEEGSGTGLKVILDTYDNDGLGEGPALDIAWGGTIFAHTLWSRSLAVPIPQVIDPATGQPADLQTGPNFADLIVDLHPNGLLDVVYKGIVVYTNLVVPGYTPMAGANFALSARTGGSLETHWVDDISISTVAPVTGPATIVTQPANASGPERGSATFSVVPGGGPGHTFQWYTNNVAVDGAVGQSLTLTGLTMDLNNLKVKVNVANPEGALDSAEATLTVIPDTLKPIVLKAQGSDSFTDVTVLFSEDIDPVSGENKDNYNIPGLVINSATMVGARAVKLTTATQAQGTAYTLTINGVKDMAATPNTIAASTTASFTSFAFQTGGLRMDVFRDIGTSGSVDDLLSAQKFIDNAPDETYYVRQFSSRPIYGNAGPDAYGGRLAGWISPLETAEYNFFIRSDDLSRLYFSTNDDAANKTMIAQVGTCCGAFHEPTEANPAPEDMSPPILLEKGKRYYIEALWKEGGGGDYVDVAWRKVGDTFPAQALPFISGNVLQTLAPPNSLVPPTITLTSPADSSQVETNVPVVISATASAASGKTVTKVEFFEQATKLGESTNAPYSLTLTNLSAGPHKFFARVSDSAGLTTDTPLVTVSVGGLSKQISLLAIDDKTTWKYDRTGRDLGTEWREPAYDDALWPSGKALIADETTTTVEPVRTPISRFNDNAEYVRTFYFRSHFNFAGPVTPGVKLTLVHVVDDGVVIYLNGHEINRLGIADDPVNYLSNADGHENAFSNPIDIPTTWLKAGDNVIAAEVHQSGGSSSDMVFGLNLTATIPAITQTLFAIDDVTTWKYDRTGRDLGTEWREPIYDDALWPSGKALIADETTTTVAPIRTPISRFNDNAEYVRTFYFRHHFNFPGELEGASLKLIHVVDDGAVFYLNGHEVDRLGIADNPVNYLSNADGHENAFSAARDIPTTWLKTGDNVFAVEVHQSGGSSSDMVFGAELTGTFFPAGGPVQPTQPKLTVTATATGLSISWVDGGQLQSADSVTGPYTTITPDASNPYVISAPTTGNKFFRVIK